MKKKNFIYLLIVIGSIVFFNSLFNGFVWDDEEQIIKNSLVYSITNLSHFFTGSTFNSGGSGGLAGMYYKPIMISSFALIYTIFGANAFFFHLFQVSIHIANSIFVFIIFRRFFTDKLSFLGSLIFLIHPINSEAVVYISALQDTLYLFFGLLCLLIIPRINKAKYILLLSCLFLLSLLSKETGALFIIISALYFLLFTQKPKLLKIVIPIIMAVSSYILMRVTLAGIGLTKTGPSPIMQIPLLERLQNIPEIVYFYIKTFFYPKDLAIAEHWIISEINFKNFYLPLILIIIFFNFIIFLGAIYNQKEKFPKSFIFFFAWFILGLGLHLQIYPLDMTVAERWFYFPVIGLIGVIVIIIQKIKIYNRYLKTIFTCAFLIIFITFSIRTIVRNSNWKDGLTLYSHDINISKNAFDLENNLGVELYRANRPDEAMIHFENSTKLAPFWWSNWNNLGVIMENKNDLEKAKVYYKRAIDNGRYYLAFENLAKVYLRNDTPLNTKLFAEQSLKVLPNNATLWSVLALSEYRLGSSNKALSAAKNAYLLDQNQRNLYIYSRLSQNLPLDIK